MLEKVSNPIYGDDGETKLLDVGRISPDSTFECIAYVRGGQHKFTRAGKPFITLYLLDVHGVVIPGYVFDVEDFKAAGLELTKVIHSVVKLTVSENYLDGIGMTVIIKSAAIIEDPTPAMVSTFVGAVDSVSTIYQDLTDGIKKHLKVTVNLPYSMCTTSYMDYYSGRVGGQCLHYYNMLKTLEVWSNDMTMEEEHDLFATFVMYIFVHNNYLDAVERGKDDIGLVQTLTASVSRYMEALKAGAGTMEVIHVFFGYKPKDLFVRMVHEASNVNLRMMKELSVYRALPTTREGDAGYGTIKRY